MTINEAIRYADTLTLNGGQSLELEISDVRVFGRLCADALRQVKKMNEETTKENTVPDAKAAKATKVDMNANAVSAPCNANRYAQVL